MADNPYSSPEAAVADRTQAPGEPISAEMMQALGDMGVWARMLAVIGFLMTALLFCGGIGTTVGGLFSDSPELEAQFGGAGLLGLGVFYLICGICYLWPSWALNRLASASSRVKNSGDAAAVAQGVDAIHKFLRAMGVMVATLFGLSIVFMAVAFAAGIYSGMQGL